MFNEPWYSVVVVFHVLFAVIGFAALGATGAYARLARTSGDPYEELSLRRYFRPGHNLAARSIFLVPVFGGVALAYSGDLGQVYPYLGIAISVVALGIATGVMWPAEAAIQTILGGIEHDDVALATACRRCELGAMVTSILFVCALFIMVFQP